jgi:predicted enzyme related to lactoylglutathione lyase
MSVVEIGACIYTNRWLEIIHFYREILELKEKDESKYHIIFESGSGHLLIQRCGHYTDNCEEKGRFILRFNVDNLSSLISKLEESNNPVMKKSLDYDWEPLAIVFDPDGNEIHLKQQG